MEEELKKFLESLNGKGLTKEQMSLAADTFVKEYKPKKPSSSKGGFTGQNMGSASASVNGGSSLVLKKTPQTYLAQAQEAEMRRNSIGQESKPTVAPKIIKQNKQIDADIARESSVNKSGLSVAEKVSTTLKKANIKSPTAGTENLDQLDDTPVAPTTQFETDKTKSINKDPYNPQYKAVSDDEVNKVASHFDGDELEGIDKKDFANYLKNNTNYYESHTGVKNLLAKSLSTYSNIISAGLNGKLAEMAGADPDFDKKAVLEEYEKHKLKSLDREYNYGNPEKRSEISEKIMKTISYKKSVNREEFDQTKEYFNGIEQSGINPLEFSKYLKNKTDFYKNGAVTSDHAAEEEFAKDRILKGYIKDREDKLATMYKYSQDEGQRSSIKSSVEDLHNQYNNFKTKFLPNITAVEKQKVERDAKVYSDLKSGKNRGTSFLQGVEDVTDAFYYGFKKPVQDVIAAGADAVGSNIGEEMRNNQNYVGWYRDKGVGGEVRVKGKSVSYKGNNYTVTEHGQIYDNDTETMINSFSKEEDLKAIANLSKESKKENQFFDQKAAFTHISSAASFLAMIALTKNVTTGTAAGLGMGAKTAATASQIAEQTAMIGTMAASGYSDTVNQLKQAGVSDIDAKSQGIKAGIVSGAVAAFAGKILNLPTSTKFAQNSAFKSVVNDFNKAFINGGEAGANEYLKSGMIKTLSKFGDMTKGGAHFAGFTLMQEAATAAINGNINESLGKEILGDKITADEVINHTIASFVSGSVLALGGNAKLNEYQKMDYLSNNLEKFKSVTQAKVEKGLMTLEEANNSIKTLVKFRKYSGKIPENISAEKVVDLLDILEKRDGLENKKKNTDKAFHEDINNELAKLKEKTEEIIGRKEDVELTDKEAALKSIKEVGKISKAFRVNKDENFEYKIDGKTYVAETREEAERSVERHYMENKDKPDEYLEAEQNHLEKVIDSLEAGKEGSSEKDIKRADQTIKSLRDRVENIKNERKSREDKAAESADPTKNGEGKEGEGINAKAKNTAEVSNFKAETERVATTKMEEETGHTFNLDGTTYDKGGLVIPVVSKNMKQSELTPEAIQTFKEEHADKIGGEAVKVGIYKFPDSDQVSIDLNIVVPNAKREEAIAFGKESGQESLFDLGTFENIKTGADGKNPKSYTAEEFKDIARRFEADKDPIGFKESEGTVEQSVSQPVDKFIDSPAKFDSPTDGKLSGTIKQDGQRLVFESGEKVFDLGNIKEVEGKSLKDLGLSVHDEVSINKNGNIEIRGKEYVNRYSNEESAVTRDSDGKVKSVTLDTPKGEKRTFKGQTAEDIVYAMKTKEFTKAVEQVPDIKSPDNFDKFIGGIDNMIKALDAHMKGNLGVNIVPAVAKGALKVIKATATATRDTVKAIEAGVKYVKSTDWYKGLTKDEKAEFDKKSHGDLFTELLNTAKKKTETTAEKLVDTVTIDNKKSTKAIVRENTGQTDKSKTITVKESTLLRDKFANLARGFKAGVKETQELKRDFIIQVKGSIQGLGKYITDAEAKTILNQVANVTETNLDKVSAVVDNLAARLENRAEKAFLNRISKMQKQAGIKARTKYGNAGENINNLIKIPADQIPKSMLREYADLMEGLSKGKNVDFDKVNDLYARMRQDILDHVELKNTLKNQPNAPADPTKKVEAMDKLRGVKASMTSVPTGKLTDFERGLLRSFIKMPEKYLESLTVEDINGLSKGLEQLSATGFVPNKVFADVVIKYQSTVAAKSIIDKVGDTLLKPVSGITAFIDGMKGKVDYSSTDFAKKIASNMFHHIDSTINGIKGTAFYDNIVHPVTSNLDKSASETNKIGQLAADYMKRAIKENGSGFKVNVRAQLVLRQREFESNPELHGTKVFELDEHMKALDKERNNIDYTRDDISVIEAEYAKVKGKTAQEMFDALSPAEKDLINFMDAHLADMQTHNRNFNNHLQGETLTYPKNYFPKRDSYTVGNPNASAEFRDRLSGVGGSTNVKSGVSNERVALGANPLDFNTVNNFMRNIGEGNMEKNLGLPLKTVFATITNLRKSDNGSLVKLANALDKTMGDLIDTQLHKSNYSYDTMGEQVFAKFTKNTFTRMLIDPIRLSYDVASNYSTVYGAYADKMPLIIRANKMLDSEVTKAIHDNISSTQAERLGGARSSDYKVASGTTIGRMGNRKVNPDFVESMVDLYKHNKLSDKVEKMGDTYYKYADLPAQHLWKMNLIEQFKKITGKEFDGKRYLVDKAYREEVQDSLQEATTQADKKTANYFNTGSSTEQKLKVQQGKGNLLYRANNFLRSFTFNENKVFWDATNKLTGFGSSTFENKGEAFRAFAVVNARSIAYSYLGQIVGNMIVKAVMGQDDSEEDEEALDKKALKRAVGQHGMLILGGNTGAVQNLVGNLAFEMLNEKITTKVQGSYNAYEDNIFYVPNGRSKYTDFLNNLGAEGLAIKTLAQSVEGTYKMIDTFSEEGEITTEDIVRFKTFQYSAALISQSTGLPLDRVGRITQKVLQKKYPYNSRKGSSTGMGSSGGMGSMGMGSGMK